MQRGDDALPGTSIQNRLEDLGSLVKFLKADLFITNLTFQKHVIDPLPTCRRSGRQPKISAATQFRMFTKE